MTITKKTGISDGGLREKLYFWTTKSIIHYKKVYEKKTNDIVHDDVPWYILLGTVIRESAIHYLQR